MLQCYVCQDWFHVECIESASCKSVGQSNENLGTPAIDSTAGTEQKSFRFVPSEREDTNMICYVCMDKHPFLYKYTPQQCVPIGLDSIVSKDLSTESSNECKMPQVQTTWPSFSTFWNSGWRNDLCRCSTCISLYREQGIQYITEEEEELEEGESIDVPEGSVNLDHLGMKTLAQQFPQEQQHDILQGFNVLAGELREYLAPLAQNGTTVTKEVRNY